MGKVDSGVRSQEISVPVDGQPAQGAFSDHYQLGGEARGHHPTVCTYVVRLLL